jgi:hypothetical protein
MERELRARVEGAMQPTSSTWQALDPDLKDMARAPEDYLRSLNVAVAHVDWMSEASFQKLLGRSHARLRMMAHRARLPNLYEKARHLSHMHPLTSIPWKVLPATPNSTFQNDVLRWLSHHRLGMAQPSVAGLPKECACLEAALIDGGHHLIRCKDGGGMEYIHNTIRDVIRAMCADAGLRATTEEPGLLPGLHDRPGDVYTEDGVGGRCAIDVTVVNAHPHAQGAEARNLAVKPGYAARAGEKKKRNGLVGGGGGLRREDALAAQGIEFWAMGFDTSGTPGDQFSHSMKKLAQTAADLRGHDEKTFKQKWTVRIGLALARAKAKVALRRAHIIAGDVAVKSKGDRRACRFPLAPLHAEPLMCMPHVRMRMGE